MNASTMKVLCGAAPAALLCAAAGVPGPAVLMTLAAAAGAAVVASRAQARRLRDAEGLVYRPAYVRRHPVQRRIASGD